MQNDTIAAVSTPPAMGGVGIIRMSGEKSKSIAEKIFKGRICQSHTIRYGFIFDPKTGETIDEVLLTYMKSPKTYTMEDIIEINCHSGIAVLNKIMCVLLENGARQAENGEFTKRAFLNGRIDLSRAEAVADIISAKTENGRQSAVNQLSGRLYEEIKAFMDRIVLCLANIEAEIEYPEHFEDGEQIFYLRTSIEELIKDAERLYETADTGRLIKEGINTVIFGKTNVGKSSLLNYLAGCDRAIVTDIHGTTRDIVEESINLNGVLLRVSDTAGIRETNDPVEKMGVDKARKAAEDADLVLYIFDASEDLDEILISNVCRPKIIAVLNKTDLDVRINVSEIEEAFGKENVIHVSVKNREGFSLLEHRIKELFFGGRSELGQSSVISNVRHKNALYKCISCLRSCIKTLDDGFPEDIVSVDLSAAYSCLGEITGDSIDEDLANKIFSEFCLGK